MRQPINVDIKYNLQPFSIPTEVKAIPVLRSKFNIPALPVACHDERTRVFLMHEIEPQQVGQLCDEFRRNVFYLADAEDPGPVPMLLSALEKIMQLRWGPDGDCGALAIAGQALSEYKHPGEES